MVLKKKHTNATSYAILYIYILAIYTIFIILTTDNTTTAGISYKELYDCKLNLITWTNNTLYTLAFQFL
jgi:hypothetical protein